MDNVDFVVSGYGTNLIAAAIPIVIERQWVLMSLFGLANNEKFNYPYYFQIGPFGPTPGQEFSRVFFALAAMQHPTPRTDALVDVDVEYPHSALAGARETFKRVGTSLCDGASYQHLL